jgi:CDK inhibitor PHO81
MVPALVHSIKSHGLALVTDRSAANTAVNISPMSDPFPRLPKGVDGELKSHGALRFTESIDV